MAPMTSRETGHGLNASAILNGAPPPDYIGGYQFWLRKPTGDEGQHEQGLLLQAGVCCSVSGGLYRRKALTRSDIHYLGFQGALGLLWADIAVPAALKISDRAWVTTQPSYSHGLVRLIQIPLGMSIEVGEHGRIDTELGLNIWDGETGYPDGLGPFMGISYSEHIGQ